MRHLIRFLNSSIPLFCAVLLQAGSVLPAFPQSINTTELLLLAADKDDSFDSDINDTNWAAEGNSDTSADDTGYEHAKPYGWNPHTKSNKSKYVTATQSQNMILHQQADNALYNQMLKVRDWLLNYAIRNRRLPEQEQGSLDQVKWAKLQLSLLVPDNPYSSVFQDLGSGINTASTQGYSERSGDEWDQDITYSGEAGDEGAPLPKGADRFEWRYNPSLNRYVAESFRKDPPVDWKANPGTITIMNNQLNMFILWGAGANGEVLKAPGSKAARIVMGHWVGGGPGEALLE